MKEEFHFNSREELMNFLSNEVVGSAEACEIIECTRQSLNKRVENGSLKPIRMGKKDKLFLKSDILLAKEHRRKK